MVVILKILSLVVETGFWCDAIVHGIVSIYKGQCDLFALAFGCFEHLV